MSSIKKSFVSQWKHFQAFYYSLAGANGAIPNTARKQFSDVRRGRAGELGACPEVQKHSVNATADPAPTGTDLNNDIYDTRLTCK